MKLKKNINFNKQKSFFQFLVEKSLSVKFLNVLELNLELVFGLKDSLWFKLFYT